MSQHHRPAGRPATETNLRELCPALLAHALTPRNLGALPHPEGLASPRGPCGDHIELYLRISDGVISQARFLSHGCLHTVACGSALTSLLQGLPLERAAQVGAAEVEAELGGLPREHRHCAALAAATLQAALRNYYQRRQAPWKEVYRRP